MAGKTHTFAVKTVALIAGEAGTLETTEGIRAMREYITGSVLALVLVCNVFFSFANFIYKIQLPGLTVAEIGVTRRASSRVNETRVCRFERGHSPGT